MGRSKRYDITPPGWPACDAGDPDWVDPKVWDTKSVMTRLCDRFLQTTPFLKPNTDPTTVSFAPCTHSDRLCRSWVHNAGHQFFYMYSMLFTKLGLRLPFSDFQLQFLNRVNAAPTQLHLNAWRLLICFEKLCRHFCALAPTVSAFFYFFQLSYDEPKMGWIHIKARLGPRQILAFDDNPFQRGQFKINFFRVEGGSAEGSSSVPFFMDENGNPKFPLHWTRSVRSPDQPAYSSLSDCDRALVNKLQQLITPIKCLTLLERSHELRCRPLFLPSSHLTPDTENHTNADLNGLDKSREQKEDQEEDGVVEVSASAVEMSMKRKRILDCNDVLDKSEEQEVGKEKDKDEKEAELSASLDMNNLRKKQKVCVEQQQMEVPPGFEAGEGVRNSSVRDGSFDVDRHVRQQLYFCVNPSSDVIPDSERFTNVNLNDKSSEKEGKEEEVVEVQASAVMKMKRKRIVDVEEMEHLRGFEGEGSIASPWDGRFDVDRHVRHHLSTDQDKLRRTGHMNVGHFVKANALQIASGAEFLVEEVEMARKAVSQLTAELEKERNARIKVAEQLEEEKVGREKAKKELARCEGEIAKARKESEYAEGCLLREWKKSVTVSFQNAVNQVRLGFPNLNLDSIALDPFKVVEGEQLVDRPSGW